MSVRTRDDSPTFDTHPSLLQQTSRVTGPPDRALFECKCKRLSRLLFILGDNNGRVRKMKLRFLCPVPGSPLNASQDAPV